MGASPRNSSNWKKGGNDRWEGRSTAGYNEVMATTGDGERNVIERSCLVDHQTVAEHLRPADQ